MNSGLLVVLIGVILIAIIVVLFLPAQRKAGTPADHYRSDYVYRDDDRYWYGGFFYNNPDDPAVFVPRRYGMGWTVNFGNPKGKLFFVGTLLLPLAIVLLSILVPGMHATGCHTFGCNP
jgi:uncharacterized membrane protein